jgi:peptidoglycan/LPS O-acetylase OafA/YrhL
VSSTSLSRLGYRPELDGLRGVAILLVLFFHVTLWPRGGVLGVDIFFTLSGFLITTLLLEEWQAQGSISLRNFYLRRYFRLFPAFALLIIIYGLFVVAFGHGNYTLRLWGAVSSITYTSNWVMAFNGPFPEWEIGHLWSLAVEEQFYVVWPLVLLLLLRGRFGLRGTKWALVGMIAAVLVWRTFLDLQGADISRLKFGTDTRFDQLLVGCLAGTIYVSRGRKDSRSRWLMVAGIVGPVFLAWRILDPNLENSVWTFKFGLTLIAIATAVLIYACVVGSVPVVKRVLQLKWLVFIGTISYSLYLWHFATSVFIRQFLPLEGWQRVASELALGLAAACGSYYVIERPFLRRRKAYERLRDTKAEVEAGERVVPEQAEGGRTATERSQRLQEGA